MKIKNLLSAALSLCLLAGCASAPKTYTTVLEGMTRHNLRAFFGEPLRIQPLSSGGEDWYYRFSFWHTQPTGASGTSDVYGPHVPYVSAGLEFSKQVVELPVHVSADGYVVPPVPKEKVVKEERNK